MPLHAGKLFARRWYCLLWFAGARAYPHKDPRDSAFPFGYKPTEAERHKIAPNEYIAPFMGGRHTVDNNEPDVQKLAQVCASAPASACDPTRPNKNVCGDSGR